MQATYKPTHNPRVRASFKRYTVVYLVLLLLSSACDSLEAVPGGEGIILNTSRVLCFEFNGLTNGESKSVESTDMLDLDNFLANEGFATDEVLRAEVTDVSIRLRFPGSENLSVFDEVDLRLSGTGSNTRVAGANDLGTGRTLVLSSTGSNVGNIVRTGSFQGILDVVGATSSSEDFLVEVELNFTVEVEGI